MKENHFSFDVVIVGAGLVGSVLATALRSLSLNVAIIDRMPLKKDVQDSRSIVLSYGSRLILDSVGLWTSLKPDVTPIRTLKLSDAGRFGMATLSAKEEQVEALGYVIEGGLLQTAFSTGLAGATFFDSAHVIAMIEKNKSWILTVEKEGHSFSVEAKCVIGADGTHSTIAQLQQSEKTHFDYEQTAIVSQVTLKRHHHFFAHERFTKWGAMAFLPRSDFQCGLIWSAPQSLATELMSLSNETFLKKLQSEFGYRLGRFIELSQRVAYPLKLTRTLQQAGPGWVLIGNAAHTLHPIAAQGLNLGLRDVMGLLNVLAEAIENKQDLFDESIMQHYLLLRKQDHERTTQFTHRLVNVFSAESWPIKKGRSVATQLIEYIPFLKHHIARQAMGMDKHNNFY